MTHPGDLSDEEILSSVRECIDLLRAEIAADEDSDDVPRELWQMVHGLTHLSLHVSPDGSVDARPRTRASKETDRPVPDHVVPSEDLFGAAQAITRRRTRCDRPRVPEALRARHVLALRPSANSQSWRAVSRSARKAILTRTG